MLVVDDSAFTREALRRALETDPALKVVGEAKNGEEAIDLARRLKPHLITMDLSMPGIGGLKAIEFIMRERPVPLVVISEKSGAPGQDLNYEAISRGALELVPKSEVFGGQALLVKRFAAQMRALAEAGVAPPTRVPAKLPSARTAPVDPPFLIGIGASTGGPRALAQVLAGLPATFPIPIAIVQHMAADFHGSFVRFLSDRSMLPVVQAEHGAQFEPGRVYVAPAANHLVIDRDNAFRLVAPRPTSVHCPSVDALFASMASSLRGRAIGVLMTGMGADGADGLLALKRSGAYTIVQDAPSCAVAGMPEAALKLDAVDEVIELDKIAAHLVGALGRPEPAVPGTKKRILLVDDSRVLLEAGRMALEEAGYEVRTLDNPLMVALHLRKDPVDLVLLDVNMPTVKGTQVVAVLRTHGLTATPVILYSDLDEGTLKAKAQECGATGWLRKTGDEDALIRAVERWIGAGSR